MSALRAGAVVCLQLATACDDPPATAPPAASPSEQATEEQPEPVEQPLEPVEEPPVVSPEVLAILESPDTFELVSVSPYAHHPGRRLRGRRIQRYVQLGRTSIPEADRSLVLAAIFDGVRQHSGIGANCFNPRHALHVVKDGAEVDFVICFECFQIEVYAPDVEDDERGYDVLFTNRAASDILNRILSEAGVPQPEGV